MLTSGKTPKPSQIVSSEAVAASGVDFTRIANVITPCSNCGCALTRIAMRVSAAAPTSSPPSASLSVIANACK